jgi:multidrug efflux pump subunit AcrB
VGLRQNASIAATRELMAKLESQLKDDPDALFWTTYVGRGAPRFVLAMDLPTPGPHMGQIVIQTPDLEARDRVKAKLRERVRQQHRTVWKSMYLKNPGARAAGRQAGAILERAGPSCPGGA